ncbi:hypothetical protein CVT24_005682 [Panaeolus cyanescens]|uniref:Carboxylic ester hydrolase n=1 Tax=Panaeolus cyanescens TaxID=181874 RepID=A0A409V986_9AGAR|nr:hypothetical protein CVT24_005682 [Panaeolus cyanescens]
MTGATTKISSKPEIPEGKGSFKSQHISIMLFSVLLTIFASYVFKDNLLVLSESLASSSSQHVIDAGYAKYLGNQTRPNTVAYLGVPYAEPPVGNLRFRAPLPLNKRRITAEAKGQVIDARNYAPFCIQGTTGSGDAGGAGSEDCLKVDIYTPLGAKQGSNFPVLVYIHGGGYIYGNPANWPFDHWVDQSPNVVVVSVYYRLSSFGFLATPALRNPAIADLNAGFLDQIEALRWVKQNIAKFGGDPKKVTINGESAGGASVELHIVANEKEQLFSQAIAQSVYRTPLPSPEQQEPLFNFYAKQAGCGAGSAEAQIACLRKASVSALARAQDASFTSAFTASGYRTFHPVIDGKVLTDFPTRSILQGKFKKVPLIVGATSNETLTGGTDIALSLKQYFPSIRDEDINQLISAYPISAFADSTDLRYQTLTGDAQLRCARSIMARKFSEVGQKSWTYRYNQPVLSGVDIGLTWHSAENTMMFRGTATGFNGTTSFTPQTPIEVAFAQELIAYWMSFVRSGDPNKFKFARSPVWPAFTSRSPNRMVLTAVSDAAKKDTESANSVEQELKDETARCDIVASQVLYQQN